MEERPLKFSANPKPSSFQGIPFWDKISCHLIKPVTACAGKSAFLSVSCPCLPCLVSSGCAWQGKTATEGNTAQKILTACLLIKVIAQKSKMQGKKNLFRARKEEKKQDGLKIPGFCSPAGAVPCEGALENPSFVSVFRSFFTAGPVCMGVFVHTYNTLYLSFVVFLFTLSILLSIDSL